MSKIRVGIVGAGSRGIHNFGQLFTEQHKTRVQIVALADTNTERAQGGLEYLGISADIYSDYHDLVARKDVDAVIITTPDYLHEEVAVAAFKHKKHVLVDKPLAITGKGCLRVIEASRKAGKLLYMGFNLRHDIVLRKLKEIVDSGKLGELFSMQAIEHYQGGRTYMSRWNRLKGISGGLWIHKGSHDFDIINWLMGKARPAKVSCFAAVSVFRPEGIPFKLRKGVKPGPTCNACAYLADCDDSFRLESLIEGSPTTPKLAAQRRMWGESAVKLDGYHKNLCMYCSDKDTHDQGITIIQYDNGATASHSEYFATPLTNRQYLLEGMLGHGAADLEANSIRVYPRWTRDEITHKVHRGAGGHGGADPAMCREFVDCILKKRRPTASGIDGAWSVAIGQAAEISRAEDRVVRITEVLDVGSDLLRQ